MAAVGGVMSQSLSSSSSSLEETVNSDSSIFSMEKEELQLLSVRSLQAGLWSLRSHASRS